MSRLDVTKVLAQGMYSSRYGLVTMLHRAVLHCLVRKVLLVLLIQHPLVLAHSETATLIEMHHVSEAVSTLQPHQKRLYFLHAHRRGCFTYASRVGLERKIWQEKGA